MKKIISFTIFLFFLFTFHKGVYSAATFTKEDVASHNTADDCYMIFENRVYRFTSSHLYGHEMYMDISSWCGQDMTSAFTTKDGMGTNHRNSTYSMLGNYYIGDLVKSKSNPSNTSTTTNTTSISSSTNSSASKLHNPYNFWVPFLLATVLYLLSYYLSGTKFGSNNNLLKRATHNLTWNSVMLILLLIPTGGFGIYMVLTYSFPNLVIKNFNMLYWHVEFSIAFAVLASWHFIIRFKQYLIPLKNLLK